MHQEHGVLHLCITHLYWYEAIFFGDSEKELGAKDEGGLWIVVLDFLLAIENSS